MRHLPPHVRERMEYQQQHPQFAPYMLPEDKAVGGAERGREGGEGGREGVVARTATQCLLNVCIHIQARRDQEKKNRQLFDESPGILDIPLQEGEALHTANQVRLYPSLPPSLLPLFLENVPLFSSSC